MRGQSLVVVIKEYFFKTVPDAYFQKSMTSSHNS
jgi:hypothetical protein